MEEIPFFPECELLHEGGANSKQLFNCCDKNPGHENFIPVKEFKMEHLPIGYRTEEVMNAIEKYCDNTVKVSVNYISPQRPDTYPNSTVPYPYSEFKGSNRVTMCGTGYIRYTLASGIVKDEHCPCRLCKTSGEPKKEYLYVTVTTAAHVIFDDLEAEHAEFEMFYDSSNRRNVKSLYGVRKSDISITNGDDGGFGGYRNGYKNNDDNEAALLEKCSEDRYQVRCVTHDPELISKLPSHGSFDFETLPLQLMVSHPHGVSKHITLGEIISRTVPVHHDCQTDDIYTIGPGSKCRFVQKTLVTNNEFFQIVDSDSDISFKSEVEYTLKERITLSLLANATYLCQYLVQNTKCNGQRYDTYMIKFPAGTRFTYGNVQDSFLLPDVEFTEENGYVIKFPKNSPYYLTYDLATCCGCSGAPVRTDYDVYPLYWDSHSGALKDGTNRSGVHSRNHVNF